MKYINSAMSHFQKSFLLTVIRYRRLNIDDNSLKMVDLEIVTFMFKEKSLIVTIVAYRST